MPAIRIRNVAACLATLLGACATVAKEKPFAEFVEPGFPFITTSVEASRPGTAFPERNFTVRGIVISLGNGAYACFDTDLLRMAVVWRGEFLQLRGMPHVSYQEPKNKKNDVTQLLGEPLLATGIYPGWKSPTAPFADPRPAGPNPAEVGRGPLAEELGRYQGLFVAGDEVVLNYRVGETEFFERPGSLGSEAAVAVSRTFRAEAIAAPVALVLGEFAESSGARIRGDRIEVEHSGGEVTVVRFEEAPEGTVLGWHQDRFVTLELPAAPRRTDFRVVAWRGPRADRDAFLKAVLGSPLRPIGPELAGAAPHWPEVVSTDVRRAAEGSGAFAVDQIGVPVPNPWRRQARPAAVDFFADGRAAVVTYEGDVWLVSGFHDSARPPQWRRFASGLYETMSLSIRDGVIHVFGRDQITALHDLNGDGEADHYENFSNLVVQSAESRMFPMDMVRNRQGGFYLALGGALDTGPRYGPSISKGFRVGSQHSGSILEVSPDGRRLIIFATGFREPFLGYDPVRDWLTASDQQGNWVPSTPLYLVRRGDFFGVPATAQRQPAPAETPALVWIPHHVDNSAAGQVYVDSRRMGPLNGGLVHLSYGKGHLIRVYPDAAGGVPQGAVISFADSEIPVLKGQVNPADGQLYLCGFQIYGSEATPIAGMARLRYTGEESALPLEVRSSERGVLFVFERPLDRDTAVRVGNYSIHRWSYRRTENYGSGHYRGDGEAGREKLAVAAAHVSRDGRSLFLHVPAMEEVMQLEVQYDIATASGLPVRSSAYFTVNRLAGLDLPELGFAPIDFAAEAASVANAVEAAEPYVPPSAQRGKRLARETGCLTCHSIDGTTEGKLGPSWAGLYGSVRTLEGGETVRADEAYLREAILDPETKRVQGFQEGMPSYRGILSEGDVESLLYYIKLLQSGTIGGGSNEQR